METLEQKLRRKKNELGLVGTSLRFQRPQQGHGIAESISHDGRELTITIREGIDLVPDATAKDYCQKRKITDPIETVAMDLLYHGCGHRELPVQTRMGCPYNAENHDQILDGVTRALKEIRKEAQAGYVANAVEDIIDLINAKKYTNLAGQVLFWHNEGVENNNKWTPFYEAFVKVNLNGMGEPADAALLRKFYTNDHKVQEAVAQFKTYLAYTIDVPRLLKVYQNQDAVRHLFDRGKWKEIGYQFAKALGPLLPDSVEQNLSLCMGKDPAQPSAFDKELQMPYMQKKVASGRYKSKEGPSSHTPLELQVDALYQSLATDIAVKTSQYTNAQELPIAGFGRRDPREDETIRLCRIKGIGFDEHGELGIKVRRHDLTVAATYKVHPTQFPRLKIALLDRSTSMAYNPENESGSNGEPKNIGDNSFIPWGDKSKYHFALLGLYGIDNYLLHQGISEYVDSEVVTFESSTSRSGRGKLRHDAERRALLRKPAGGTSLDIDILKQAAEEGSFLISISDGDIANWNEVKNAYKKLIENVDYAHIHIGAKNNFTRDLESWGIIPHYVQGNEDLSRMMIDTTMGYFSA